MFDQLKPLMRNGERYIVVESGRPEYVLLRFEDYATLVGRTAVPMGTIREAAASGRSSGWERANAELAEAGIAEVGIPPGLSGMPASDPTTIRLEDLPL